MKDRLEKLIAEYRIYVRSALRAADMERAQFFVRIVVGFQICLRLLERPEACAYPPPPFESRF